MVSMRELKQQVKAARKKKAKEDEKKRLQQELFNLKHGKKVKVLKNIGANLKHMGKNAVAMTTPKTVKKKKKKKSYDPFKNVNFNAFR